MPDENRTCQNCGALLHGEYCSACGQHSVDLKVPLKDLLKELIEELFSFDSKLIHSFLPFLTKPGFLAAEFVAGRRTRYISPFKMYFFMSFLYFFVTALLQPPVNTQTGNGPLNVDSLLASAKKDTVVTIIPSKGMKLSFSKSDSTKSSNRFGHRFDTGLKKLEGNPQVFIDKLSEHTPQIVFLLLPIFALLLKLMYVRSGAYYIQHIVFAFYFHSYVFCVLLAISLLSAPGWDVVTQGANILYFAIPINLYLGLRRVYGQSRRKTFFKFTLLSGSYGCVLIGAALAATFVLISYL
jgi:Protein of unknown function (DUF3667)